MPSSKLQLIELPPCSPLKLMFGWQRVVHSTLPAGVQALPLFFELAQVH